MAGKVCLLFTVVSILLQGLTSGQVDRTREPEAAGIDVVFASVSRIQESGIFPDNKRFLRRLAYVETRDGVDINTFRDGYFGGIWQVDEAVYNVTRDTGTHQGLEDLYTRILTVFGVDWAVTSWNDLLKPLFSALAVSLYLTTINEAIPGIGDLEGQGQYWLDHFTSNPMDTVQLWVDSVNELELEGEAVQ